MAYLRDASQLPAFKRILQVYEKGSGALNSWGAKTQGLRIGASRDEAADPFPDGWDPELVSFSSGAVRTLGVFLGAPQAVAHEWHKKITARISARLSDWRRTRPPSTLYGKSLALKSSVLAVAWYLIGHQTPPGGQLDALLTSWQSEAFRFLDQSFHSFDTGARGSTIVTRRVLVQDHAEHGARVADVESVTRAHYASWRRHLVAPPAAAHMHIAMSYVNAHYGHLRQGPRLLLSNCDFLNLGSGPDFWRNALTAAGMSTRYVTETYRSVPKCIEPNPVQKRSEL